MIHSRFIKLGICLHISNGRIDEGQYHGRAVAAHIQDTSAAQFLVQPEIFSVILSDECCIDVIYLTYLTAFCDLFKPFNIRAVQVCVSLHQDGFVFLSSSKHALHLSLIHRHGLLAQNMLMCL